MSTNSLTQIHFKHIKGASMLNTTDYDVLKNLGLPIDEEFGNLWRLDIGTIVTIDSVKYEIFAISTRLYEDNDEMNQGKGYYSGEGEPFPYNFGITYHLDTK